MHKHFAVTNFQPLMQSLPGALSPTSKQPEQEADEPLSRAEVQLYAAAVLSPRKETLV
jgi:hypothetical protein